MSLKYLSYIVNVILIVVVCFLLFHHPEENKTNELVLKYTEQSKQDSLKMVNLIQLAKVSDSVKTHYMELADANHNETIIRRTIAPQLVRGAFNRPDSMLSIDLLADFTYWKKKYGE